MFSKLFGKKKEVDPLVAKMNEIRHYFENKEYETVIAKGEDLLGELHDEAKEIAEVMQLVGVAHSRTDNRDKAIPYFVQLSERRDNPGNNFNLAMMYILNKDAEKGIHALEDAIALFQEIGKYEGISIPYMIFYAMNALAEKEEYNLAFDQLDRLAVVYKEMSTTDSRFLQSRGYMPFGAILESVKLVIENQTTVDAIEWLTSFAQALDEDGRLQLEDMIEDIRAELSGEVRVFENEDEEEETNAE